MAATSFNPLIYGVHFLLPFERYYSVDQGKLFLNEYYDILKDLAVGQSSLENLWQSIKTDNASELIERYRIHYQKIGKKITLLCNYLLRDKRRPLFQIPHGDFCRNLSSYVNRNADLLSRKSFNASGVRIPAKTCSSLESTYFELSLINFPLTLMKPLDELIKSDYPPFIYNIYNVPDLITDIKECFVSEFQYKKEDFLNDLAKLSLDVSKVLTGLLGKLGAFQAFPLSEQDLGKVRDLKLVDSDLVATYDKCASDPGNFAYNCLYHVFGQDCFKIGKREFNRKKFKAIISLSTATKEYSVQRRSFSFFSQVFYSIVFRNVFSEIRISELILMDIPAITNGINEKLSIFFQVLLGMVMRLSLPLPIESLILTSPQRLPFIFAYYVDKELKPEDRFTITHHYLTCNSKMWHHFIKLNAQSVANAREEYQIPPLELAAVDSEFLRIYNSFLIFYRSCVQKSLMPLTFPLYNYCRGKDNNGEEMIDFSIGKALTDFAKNLLQFACYKTPVPKCYHDLARLNKRLSNFYLKLNSLHIRVEDLIFLRKFWSSIPD